MSYTVLYKRARDISFDVVDKKGEKHTLVIKGANAKIRNEDGLVIPSSALPFGENAYGITTDVDAELWKEVVKVYGSMNIFKLGIIKGVESKAVNEAKEEIKEVEKTDDPIIVTEGEDVDKPKTRKSRTKKA